MNMKVIRQIKEVSVYENSDEENNNDLTLATFDNEPGFYQQVIKPMLAPGHEKELISWLKEIGLLPQSQKCKNADTNEFCNAPMRWTPARIVDSYQWKCLSCSQKRTIRDDSVFHNVRCKFKDAIRVMLGWCKDNDEEMMANMLSIRKQVIKVIYSIASKTAEKYIKSHLTEFKLGGPGIVVLIETYPDANSSINPQPYTSNTRPILCIAEIKNIPTRFWFEALDRYSTKASTEQMDCINEKALRIIQQIVLPGSIIVANLNSTICSFYHLQALQHYYPTIVSTDGVSRHDSALQSLVSNLGVIWRPAWIVCEEALCYTQDEVQQFLVRQLFRQRFGSESFQTLLNELSY